MKPLLLSLLLAVTANAQRSGSDLGINANYDRFKNTTILKLTESLMPKRNGYVLLHFIAEFDGQGVNTKVPKRIAIMIESFTEDWYFLKSEHTLRAIRDGERYELGRMVSARSDVVRAGAVNLGAGSAFMTNRGVIEVLSLSLSREVISDLAQSDKLEIQVGPFEAEITSIQRESIKEWLALFH